MTLTKPKCSEEYLSQCHFADHKSHRDWPLGSNPSLCDETPATYRLNYDTAWPIETKINLNCI